MTRMTQAAGASATDPGRGSGARYRWRLLRAGPLRLDGGSMFGVVPRVIWSKLTPPDEEGRIAVAHNCLLLERADAAPTAAPGGGRVVIEVGSGDKFDAKMRRIFGLNDYSILDALDETGCRPEDVGHVIVSHLHFDHAGGLTRRVREGETPDWMPPERAGAGVKLTFPRANVYVQRREWEDALANNSVMTRTYLRENLEPIRERVGLLASPPPYPAGYHPRKDEAPPTPLDERMTEVLPGIRVFLVPGHTWGQHAIAFTDDRGRMVVFTPDVLPTVSHVGAAYNMAYDVEPYMSTVNRRWFLDEAARRNWLLVLDHEPGNPCQRVRPDGKGWFELELAADET